MKWFHHECAARHDPKLQILGSKYGAEGIGIYWGLLEEIGQHSDTFHLKVSGVDEEIDQKYLEFLQNSEKSNLPSNSTCIPILPLKILSRNLFTSPKRVMLVIQTAAAIGLFNLQKWNEFNVLYSQSFEQRADDYTRRIQRNTNKIRTDSAPSTDNVRTQSEESPNTLQSESDKVLLETETKAEARQERDSEISMHARDKINLKNEPYLIDLDEEGFQEYSRMFRSKIVQWNEEHRNKFNWNPSDDELHKIFLGGSHDRKVSMCYDAYKILHEKIHYPELVLRALQLMLKASEKTRITNPFGWLWTCLHGNGDGTTPWVQLLTADEESNVGTILRKRTTTSHPP